MKAPSSSTAAIEAELTPEQRSMLRDVRATLHVDHAEWPSVPELRLFVTLSVSQLAERIEAEDSVSASRALLEACVRLDLRHDAMRQRLYRASASMAPSSVRGRDIA